VGPYFVEGHVPTATIARMLRERPRIRGIALPGMPPGTPGMGGTRTGPLVLYAVSEGGTGEFERLP
jgi:hypothetical protein